MKNPLQNFKKPEMKVPKHAKWALGIFAGLVGLGFAVYFGFYLLMLFVVVSSVVVGYWPVLAVYFVAGGVLGAAIGQKRSGAWGAGIWAGLFYALLTALGFLVAGGVWAISTGFH